VEPGPEEDPVVERVERRALVWVALPAGWSGRERDDGSDPTARRRPDPRDPHFGLRRHRRRRAVGARGWPTRSWISRIRSRTGLRRCWVAWHLPPRSGNRLSGCHRLSEYTG